MRGRMRRAKNAGSACTCEARFITHKRTHTLQVQIVDRLCPERSSRRSTHSCGMSRDLRRVRVVVDDAAALFESRLHGFLCFLFIGT